MRRIGVLGTFAAVGCLMVLARKAKLHERLMARCQAFFERMPEAFPPKKAMRSIEDIDVRTARILDLLETPQDKAAEPTSFEASWTEEGGHAVSARREGRQEVKR
jgi:hypothetical protein